MANISLPAEHEHEHVSVLLLAFSTKLAFVSRDLMKETRGQCWRWSPVHSSERCSVVPEAIKVWLPGCKISWITACTLESLAGRAANYWIGVKQLNRAALPRLPKLYQTELTLCVVSRFGHFVTLTSKPTGLLPRVLKVTIVWCILSGA